MSAIDPGTSTQQLTPVPWPEESDLDDDYLDSGLDTDELPGRPLRKRFGPLTAVLLALALAAVAFYGGVVVEKRQLKSSPSALASRFRAAVGAGAGGFGAGGGGAGGVTGTITLVDGAAVYVTQADGTIVKAITSAASQITVSSPGSVTSLRPGDNVTISGPAGANGDVTATSIRDNGAGVGGGGRRTGATGGGAPPVPAGPPGG